MEYIETGCACDDYTKRLSKDVAIARRNREWRVEYMKTLLHDSDVRREGREEGREEGRAEEKQRFVQYLLSQNMPSSEICAIAQCDEEFVRKVIDMNC